VDPEGHASDSTAGESMHDLKPITVAHAEERPCTAQEGGEHGVRGYDVGDLDVFSCDDSREQEIPRQGDDGTTTMEAFAVEDVSESA
jgi:hypothetical protein